MLLRELPVSLFGTKDRAYYYTCDCKFLYKWWCFRTYRFYKQSCSRQEAQAAFDEERVWHSYDNCVLAGLDGVPFNRERLVVCKPVELEDDEQG